LRLFASLACAAFKGNFIASLFDILICLPFNSFENALTGGFWPYDSLGIHPAGGFLASFGSYSFPYLLVS